MKTFEPIYNFTKFKSSKTNCSTFDRKVFPCAAVLIYGQSQTRYNMQLVFRHDSCSFSFSFKNKKWKQTVSLTLTDVLHRGLYSHIKGFLFMKILFLINFFNVLIKVTISKLAIK